MSLSFRFSSTNPSSSSSSLISHLQHPQSSSVLCFNTSPALVYTFCNTNMFCCVTIKAESLSVIYDKVSYYKFSGRCEHTFLFWWCSQIYSVLWVFFTLNIHSDFTVSRRSERADTSGHRMVICKKTLYCSWYFNKIRKVFQKFGSYLQEGFYSGIFFTDVFHKEFKSFCLCLQPHWNVFWTN